jgi:hypothetical protein
MNNITGFSQFSMQKIKHHNIPSAVRCVAHDDSMPVPRIPESHTLDSDSESEENKKMATPFRNNAKSGECGTSWLSE